jgi:hypothetical protein
MTISRSITPVKRTLLSDAHPLGKAERDELAKAWKKRRLESAIVSLVMDDEFANEICTWIAENDRFFDLIRELRNQKKRRRPTVWTDAAHIVLLCEYASSFESMDTHVPLERRVNTPGRVLSSDSIDNQILKAISKVKVGKIVLPDWAQAAIQDRMNRGTKTDSVEPSDKKKSSKLP